MRRPGLAFLLASLAAAGCFGSGPEGPTTSVPPSTSVPGTNPPSVAEAEWMIAKPMPTARTEVTCAFVKQFLYVLGGFTSDGQPTDVMEGYTPALDTWHSMERLPAALHHATVVPYSNELYLFGGYTGASPFVGTTVAYRYTPLPADAWTVETVLPRPRGAHAAILRDDDVYLIGGAPSQPGMETYASVDIYNLRSKTWRLGPDLAAPKEHLAGANANGTFVVAGGRRMSLSNFDTAETLGPTVTAWQAAEKMPTGRGGIAAAAWGDQAFFFGGERAGGTFNETEAYIVGAATWSRYPAMPHPRHGLCAAKMEDGIHVVGGGPQPGLTVSAHHEVLRIPESQANRA